MNLDNYNDLPSDLKAVIDDEVLRTKLEESNFEDGIAIEKTSLKWAEEKYGTEIIYPSKEAEKAFLNKLTESKAVLAKKLDDLELPGSKMVETISQYATQ